MDSDDRELIANQKYLVIDDFDQFRQYLRQLLRSIGANDIDIAHDGKQALEQLTHRHYDVVYCDYNLGSGKDGQQLLEEVRSKNLISELTLFIMVTVENAMDMVMGAVEFRPDDYLAKPFNKQLLRKRLLRQLQRIEKLRPLYELQQQGELEQAITLSKQLERQLPHYQTLLQRYQTEMLMKLDRVAEAISIYQQLINQRPLPWAMLGKAEAHLLQGELQLAEELLQRLLHQNPSMVAAYDLLAQIRWRQNRIGEAEGVLQEATSLSPKNVSRQERLARAALHNGHLDVALSAARAVINYATTPSTTMLATTLASPPFRPAWGICSALERR